VENTFRDLAPQGLPKVFPLPKNILVQIYIFLGKNTRKKQKNELIDIFTSFFGKIYKNFGKNEFFWKNLQKLLYIINCIWIILSKSGRLILKHCLAIKIKK
jgi:hypothetical protein